jgi:hypothetical protein
MHTATTMAPNIRSHAMVAGATLSNCAFPIALPALRAKAEKMNSNSASKPLRRLLGVGEGDGEVNAA